MSRFPWRVRMVLATIVSAIAGGYVTDSQVGTGADEATAGAVVLAAVLAVLGCIINGEEKTTPMSEPVGNDGLPMLTWSEAQSMQGGQSSADVLLADLFAQLGRTEDDEDHDHGEDH